MSEARRAGRRYRYLGAALLCATVVTGCAGETGGTAVGTSGATAFVPLTSSSSATPTVPSTSGPATTDQSVPNQAGTDQTSTDATTAAPPTTKSRTSRATGATGSTRTTATLGPSIGADGKPVVAYWYGEPPADPDTPGPETGPACKADPQYVNEPTTGLQPDVAAAWDVTVAAAKRAGITLCLNDGKRSRAQQQAQFDAYEDQYGTEVAEQLVLPPDRSAHVLGVAVDAQPAAGWQWLQQTKGSLGFCRRYDNEGWHFEYAPQFKTAGCPARLPKPVG